jgi:4-diphosphocytidyl-2-C-methyl-D-erythritol kinase
VPLLTRGIYHWVFAVSRDGLSTPAVFARFDKLVDQPGPLAVSDELLNALARGEIAEVAAGLANDLQAAAFDLRPELSPLLRSGLDAGALGAVLSGSGPTIAFLCATPRAAQVVSQYLSDAGGLRAVRYARGPAPGAHVVATGD